MTALRSKEIDGQCQRQDLAFRVKGKGFISERCQFKVPVKFVGICHCMVRSAVVGVLPQSPRRSGAPPLRAPGARARPR